MLVKVELARTGMDGDEAIFLMGIAKLLQFIANTTLDYGKAKLLLASTVRALKVLLQLFKKARKQLEYEDISCNGTFVVSTELLTVCWA